MHQGSFWHLWHLYGLCTAPLPELLSWAVCATPLPELVGRAVCAMPESLNEGQHSAGQFACLLASRVVYLCSARMKKVPLACWLGDMGESGCLFFVVLGQNEAKCRARGRVCHFSGGLGLRLHNARVLCNVEDSFAQCHEKMNGEDGSLRSASSLFAQRLNNLPRTVQKPSIFSLELLPSQPSAGMRKSMNSKKFMLLKKINQTTKPTFTMSLSFLICLVTLSFRGF